MIISNYAKLWLGLRQHRRTCSLKCWKIAIIKKVTEKLKDLQDDRKYRRPTPMKIMSQRRMRWECINHLCD
jgi:hypothetical protein